MRCVVIGATGNVGTAVLRRLREVPDTSLVGVARRMPGGGRAYEGVEWHPVDIGASGARARLAEAFAGADAVVHLAWLLQSNREERTLRRANIEGTRNVLRAVADAGVPHLVALSSVGAYSPGPKTRRVDEGWPTGGIHTSHYSRHKAVLERLLDRFADRRHETTVTRLRPGLIFQRDAGREIPRYFLGPLVPTSVLRSVRPPVLPLPRRIITQAVHADDVAEAVRLVLDRRAGGAFNLAAEPVLDPEALATAFGATRSVPVPFGWLRALAAVTWHLRLQPTDPGWLDIAALSPVMSTDRARAELGWEPVHSSVEALAELVDGMADGANLPGSPPLG